MIRKDVIIAILATFCLTIMLFVVLPTRSSPSAGEYDSWADINDDGKINMYDIGYTAQRFGATGDPTKNVNVTNFPSQQPEPSWRFEQYNNFNVSWKVGESSVYPIWRLYCGGYSRIMIWMELTSLSPSIQNNETTVYLQYINWLNSSSAHANLMGFTRVPISVLNITLSRGGLPEVDNTPEFESKGPYFELQFSYTTTCPSDAWMQFEIFVYLRNE